MENLILDCESVLESLLLKINHKDCKTLGELFIKDKNSNKILIRKDEIKRLGYTFNNRLTKSDKNLNEIKGIYMFGSIDEVDKIEPIYIGISGTILRRIRQHCWGKYHSEATLAYLMTSSDLNHQGRRDQLSYSELELRQVVIRNFKVAFFPLQDDYSLYFMEVYIAGRLKIKWNSFRTH
ncbi:MAG: hypothetical protein JST55_04460 [Bacteroidetes bacterium]|nr:hypothetical protein [Bacteroidota bacterium]